MAKENILIVDDEKDILELLCFNLKKEGYNTFTAISGEEALVIVREKTINLIVLDLMLPGLDGLEVCRALKQNEKTKEIPVIMLTAKSEDSDIILGLELGADDYLTKPFIPKILISRIRAVLRRAKRQINEGSKKQVTIHNMSIDPVKHKVLCLGKPVELSATEFAILKVLAENPGWVFSRDQIINAVKGDNYPVTDRSVDVQILGIRKKLMHQGHFIETVRGIGYRMKEED